MAQSRIILVLPSGLENHSTMGSHSADRVPRPSTIYLSPKAMSRSSQLRNLLCLAQNVDGVFLLVVLCGPDRLSPQPQAESESPTALITCSVAYTCEQCDRVFPCKSCSKRGCADICPQGKLTRLINVSQIISYIRDRCACLRERDQVKTFVKASRRLHFAKSHF
jgi:hypothetical protein